MQFNMKGGGGGSQELGSKGLTYWHVHMYVEATCHFYAVLCIYTDDEDDREDDDDWDDDDDEWGSP